MFLVYILVILRILPQPYLCEIFLGCAGFCIIIENYVLTINFYCGSCI